MLRTSTKSAAASTQSHLAYFMRCSQLRQYWMQPKGFPNIDGNRESPTPGLPASSKSSSGPSTYTVLHPVCINADRKLYCFLAIKQSCKVPYCKVLRTYTCAETSAWLHGLCLTLTFVLF